MNTMKYIFTLLTLAFLITSCSNNKSTSSVENVIAEELLLGVELKILSNMSVFLTCLMMKEQNLIQHLNQNQD